MSKVGNGVVVVVQPRELRGDDGESTGKHGLVIEYYRCWNSDRNVAHQHDSAAEARECVECRRYVEQQLGWPVNWNTTDPVVMK